jgi:hypothetical protein
LNLHDDLAPFSALAHDGPGRVLTFCYDPWRVIDRRGRTWQVMADASLNARKEYQAEIVSPILHYDDIGELQEVVRAVRRAGARSDESAGIHIHVDAARFDARAVTKEACRSKVTNRAPHSR